MSITVYGASDDLIEIEGDIDEEFTYDDPDDEGNPGDLLTFSDGTVLRIGYVGATWRITPVARGRATLTNDQAPEDDEEKYTDRATLDGDITWVVHSHTFVKARKAVAA